MKIVVLIFVTLFASGSAGRKSGKEPAVNQPFADIDKKILMYFPGQGGATKQPDDVCYGVLGCFSMASPWYDADNRAMPAPSSPADIQTRFFLHTRKQLNSFNLSTSDTEFNTEGSDYDGSKETYFITHGFMSNSDLPWVHAMKDAILKNHDANVILVDWGKGSKIQEYLQAASNIRVVAATLIKLGNYLIDKCGSDPSRFNVIGHSLGAQTSAYMCKGIPDVAVLYALDPAQPAFEGYDKEVRLDKTDAKFVQVIHTNGKLFFPLGGLGMIKPHGHVDFYLNGGADQPGCEEPPRMKMTSFDDVNAAPKEVLAHYLTCSHMRACLFFTASILHPNCTFWGHSATDEELQASIMSGGRLTKQLSAKKACDTAESCSPLGFETIRYPGRGAFVVATTAQEPFCSAETTSDKTMRQFRSVD